MAFPIVNASNMKNAQKEEMYVHLLCARDDKLLCVDIVQHTNVNVQKSGYIKVKVIYLCRKCLGWGRSSGFLMNIKKKKIK